MLDSIHVGVTALVGYQKGLRVIANNTANMNTPGYKSATLQFADLFYANGQAGGGNEVQLGYGLDTRGTHLDFRQGDLRQTGNDFDLAVDGDGLFVLRDAQGQTRYTRAGQFEFNAEGVFVNRGDGSQVMGLADAGQPGRISIAGLRVAAGKATTTAHFTGNLSSTSSEPIMSSVKIFDGAGGEHALSLKLTNTDATTPGSWDVELSDGATTLGTRQIVFVDGRPAAAASKLSFTYTRAGQPEQDLVLDFSTDATSFASGNLSTLAMSSQDGYAAGNLAKVTFDAAGVLVASYSNGQTAKGSRLALARFATPDAVESVGGNLFAEADGIAWQVGAAGQGAFGAVRAGSLEISNVDLSREFSDLVVMQRGYQAASQIVSTANDLLQELFGMKRK
jgi:flagellar hook protein FlgE